jgi:hypothetical protein
MSDDGPGKNEKPAWRSAEQLVAIIEKALTPDARVEHNQWLPVVGEDRMRQCDVVIRYGKPPRDHFVIVEVQARGAKPDINTFGGWVDKMNDISASGLICVSEAGFPDSIINKVATKIGPRVRLVTLDPGVLVFPGGTFSMELEIVHTLLDIRKVEFPLPDLFDATLDQSTRFAEGDLILSFPSVNGPKISLVGAIRSVLSTDEGLVQKLIEAQGKLIKVNLTMKSTDEVPLWLHIAGGTYRIRKWATKVLVRRIDGRTPVEIDQRSYKQEGVDGALAWTAVGSAVISGMVCEVKVVLTPNEKGEFLTNKVERKTP